MKFYKLRKKLKLFKPDVCYNIDIDEIKVSKRLLGSFIRPEKWKRKVTYYNNTGILQSKIILDYDFNLIDGYSSYKIARINKLKTVPVYFQKEGK